MSLAYEAAVAGGIPVIKALREGLVGNRRGRVFGILNGTCNYILTAMRETAREFAAVLAEAQALGYAEADPSFDVDGVDTAHKLAILATVAFGCTLDFGAVHIEGIRHVSPVDIAFAEELGYRIKLLGIASLTDGAVERRVHPCMVPIGAPVAHVDGVFNAIVADGDFADRIVQEGRGAGERPTASAVVADLADIACGRRTPTFGIPVAGLRQFPGPPDEPSPRRLLRATDGARPAGRARRRHLDPARQRRLHGGGVAARASTGRGGAGGDDDARDGRGRDDPLARADRRAAVVRRVAADDPH